MLAACFGIQLAGKSINNSHLVGWAVAGMLTSGSSFAANTSGWS